MLMCGRRPQKRQLTRRSLSFSFSEWRQVDQQPIKAGALYRLAKLLKVHRLLDLAIGAEVITVIDVGTGLRAGKDHDRDAGEFWIFLDLGEHITAMFAGKVQIENDQVRPRLIGMNSLAVQQLHGLHTIDGDAYTKGVLGFLQDLMRQIEIGRIIVHQ